MDLNLPTMDMLKRIGSSVGNFFFSPSKVGDKRKRGASPVASPKDTDRNQMRSPVSVTETAKGGSQKTVKRRRVEEFTQQKVEDLQQVLQEQAPVVPIAQKQKPTKQSSTTGGYVPATWKSSSVIFSANIGFRKRRLVTLCMFNYN